MVRHELIKRSTKSSQDLIVYTTTHCARGTQMHDRNIQHINDNKFSSFRDRKIENLSNFMRHRSNFLILHDL